jgi:hypothetical protein
MSMSAVLIAVRTRLRTVAPDWGLRENAIRIEPDGHPPPKATGHYIAIDESNIDSIPNMEEGLRERYEISVYCCREANPVSPERLGDMLESTDRYLASIVTLEQMERMVLQTLHGNRSIPQLANAQVGLPGSEDLQGDIFQEPLYYVGRGRMGTYIQETAQDYEPQSGWRLRELRFRGMLRVQRLESLR